MLAHLYGPEVAGDVVNALVYETLTKAISEQNVQPINQPQVEAGKFDQAASTWGWLVDLDLLLDQHLLKR